jgi:hypothetical protein
MCWGIGGHFRDTEARDACEKLFKSVIFVQNVKCPRQDTAVDPRGQFRANILDGIRYTELE